MLSPGLTGTLVTTALARLLVPRSKAPAITVDYVEAVWLKFNFGAFIPKGNLVPPGAGVEATDAVKMNPVVCVAGIGLLSGKRAEEGVPAIDWEVVSKLNSPVPHVQKVNLITEVVAVVFVGPKVNPPVGIAARDFKASEAASALTTSSAHSLGPKVSW